MDFAADAVFPRLAPRLSSPTMTHSSASLVIAANVQPPPELPPEKQRLWARAYILARRMDADMLAHLVADYLCELDHLSDEEIAAKLKPPHIPLEQAEANGPSERRKRGAARERAKPTAKPIKKKGG